VEVQVEVQVVVQVEVQVEEAVVHVVVEVVVEVALVLPVWVAWVEVMDESKNCLHIRPAATTASTMVVVVVVAAVRHWMTCSVYSDDGHRRLFFLPCAWKRCPCLAGPHQGLHSLHSLHSPQGQV
jgi:hypothetical protein